MQGHQNTQIAPRVAPITGPTAGVAAPAAALPANDFARRAAFLLALGVIFVRLSMVHETITFFLGINTRILYLLGPPAILGALLAGAPRRILSWRIGWCWVGFTIWMALAIPFSSWPGGSLHILLTWVRTELPMLLFAGGLVYTLGEARTVYYVIAAACAFNVISGSLFANDEYERLMLSFSTVSNANDFAAHLLVTMPFLLYVVLQNKSVVIRIAALGFLCFGLKLLLQTGSRGGLLALIAACGVYFFTSPVGQRLKMMIAVPVIAVVLLSIIPTTTLLRLVTFSETEKEELGEAVGSQEAREYVLRKSLEFTFTHPLFGVGPGQFSTSEGKSVQAEGRRGYWHDTHNSFTQVSSEMGIPGILFYGIAIFSTIGSAWGIWKRAKAARNQEMTALAQCVLMSAVGCCVAIAFLSLAYRYYFLMLGGLVITLLHITQQMMRTQVPASPNATGRNRF